MWLSSQIAPIGIRRDFLDFDFAIADLGLNPKQRRMQMPNLPDSSSANYSLRRAAVGEGD